MPTLINLMEGVEEISRSIFAEDQSVSPMWIVDFGKKVECYQTMWRDKQEKAVLVAMVKDRIKRGNAERFVFVSEVWLATAERREDLPDDLENHPYSTEAIMIIGEDRTTLESFIWEIPIVNKSLENTIRKDQDYTSMSGQMVNMFDLDSKRH